MATVILPQAALPLTHGAAVVEAEGRTVGQLIRNLDAAYPGILDLLTRNDALRPGIMVAVDGTIGDRRLLQPVTAESEVRFIPALSGG